MNGDGTGNPGNQSAFSGSTYGNGSNSTSGPNTTTSYKAGSKNGNKKKQSKCSPKTKTCKQAKTGKKAGQIATMAKNTNSNKVVIEPGANGVTQASFFAQ